MTKEGKNSMTYEAALKIIEETSLEKLREIPLENLATLTNDFYHEDAVRAIIAKGTTLEKQRDAFNMLNMAYESCYEQGWDKPDYFDDIQVCLNLGRMIEDRITASTDNPPIKEIVYNISTKKPAKTQETAQLQSRIAELEAQVQQATAEKEVLKKQVEEYRKQQKAGEMQEIRNDEWIVELLAHLCYEDEQVARSILDEIRGKEDPVIADIILERKQRNQISPKTQNRELWRILHAAKLYRGIEGNFNTALRRRQ